MEMRIITETQLCEYEAWLREAEKSCDGVQTAAD